MSVLSVLLRNAVTSTAQQGPARGLENAILKQEQIFETAMPPTNHQLRALLNSLLRSDADLDAFAGDHFPEASRRFTDGMDRVRKTNILLQYADPDRLAKELQALAKPPLPVELPLTSGRIKILFLASNPISTSQLDLTREARQIEERLGKIGDVFVVVPRLAVRRSELQRLLLEEKPHVLHFSSHGSTQAQLLLEDDDGNAAPVEKAALVDLIELFKDRLQLVVLNACNTQPLARALVRHVACAIGMRESISNKASVAFAGAFYQALAFGEPIERAFLLARNELDLQHIPEGKTLALEVKQGVDAKTLVLTGR